MVAKTLHDQSVCDSLKRRIAQLEPSSDRRWGKMTVDQMLWHVNCSLENALGRYPVKDVWLPMPKSFVKYLVLRSPMRHKNAQTAKDYLAKSHYDFAAE